MVVRRHGALAAAVVVTVVLIAAMTMIVTTSPGSAVPRGPGGTYLPTDPISIGPSDATRVDPSHAAWTNRPADETLRVHTHIVKVEVDSIGSAHALGGLISYKVSGEGIVGGVVEQAPMGGLDVRVNCESPAPGESGCVSHGGYTITIEATWTARPAFCYPNPNQEGCDQYTVSNSITRTVMKGYPPSDTSTTAPSTEPPVASFEYVRSAAESRQFEFRSTSSDPDTPFAELAHEWDFGDGRSSTEPNPTHRYEAPGAYTVVLTVKDPESGSDTATRTVEVDAPLVVNSTRDRPAEDAHSTGCDTGDVVSGRAECTLRAAIETVNAQGGGEITFDVGGGGMPLIVTSGLPSITQAARIDGTTAPGGWVAVEVLGSIGLRVEAGQVAVRGLAVSARDVAVELSGGSGHIVRGNRLGTNPGGTGSVGLSGYGVTSSAPGVEVADNVIAGAGGVLSRGASATIVDNHIGVSEAGAILGGVKVGVLSVGSGATVSGNVVHGETAGVVVSGEAASDATITNNHIGTTAAGSTLAGVEEGIRIEGSPGARITGNHLVVDGAAAIAIAGSAQSRISPNGTIELRAPMSAPTSSTSTGGRATVADNVIDGNGAPTYGIAAWARADGLAIERNTITTASSTHVTVHGGSEHRVTGNVLGSATGHAKTAVDIADARGVTVGGPGTAGNHIIATDTAVALSGATDGARVEGNRIEAPSGASDHVGVLVLPRVKGAVITANTIEGGAHGVRSSAVGVEVSANSITRASAVGISAHGDAAQVRDNIVVASGTGISVGGSDVEVQGNRVGVTAADVVEGNAGAGIVVLDGDALVERNLVAGSGAAGIEVAAAARGDLKANQVWESDGPALDVSSGPDAPKLVGAIREGAGGEARTTLILRDLPDVGGGRIEVFANDSCSDPEAAYVLEVTRATRPGQTHRAIIIRGAANRDHYTVTYTSPEGSTSNLSGCQSIADHPDADGDGSVDLLDGAFGFEGDPTRAIVVSEDERLLLVATEDGRLEDVELGADPAPGSHPAGWELAYGALGFRIVDLPAGGAAKVVVASLEEATTAGNSYWKYGPETPGAPASWYRFDADPQSGTGATQTTVEVAGAIRRAWVLELRDGARGDADGGANGTITDPGGPVSFEGTTDPEVPTPPDPEVPTPPDGETTPTTGAPTPPQEVTPTTSPSTRPGGSPGPTAPGAGGGASGPRDALPRTGSDSRPMVAIGSVLLFAGAGTVWLARRRARTARS